MNELLKINYEAEQPTVSARDLHEQLHIGTKFTTWFERMKEYGFSEGKEFFPKLGETSEQGGRPQTDFQISVDMAKQICMIQRSPEGKQIRQYFIDLEKAWNTPEQIMARALKMANHSIESLKGRCKFLGEQVVEQQQIITELQPKAFTGNMYVLHGEGIPLIVPIDQEKVVRAVQVNSKISKGLYSRLGEDVDLLKRKITAQISRGVATGMSYSQMAQQLAGYTKTGYNNAVRITRTEGHRIQQESTMDACYAARERGADVVKQWDATMDANTRESHQMVDGEVRALDEKFSNGLMYPGDPSGSAAEVINCRCVLLQRAKWALDQKELDRLKERASFYGLDKRKSFDEFNKKYIGTVENSKGNKIKMDLQFFAKIPDEKLTEYALNFEHPTGKEKAKAFKEALGYTKESYTDLKTKILDSFDEKELVYKREDKYGKRYEQIMQITGPNGKTANVLTAWIKDNDNAEPRLTSIYVDKR